MSWDAWKEVDLKPEESPTWGDYGKAAAGTVAGIGAGQTGLLRRYFDAGQNPNVANVFKELQGASRLAGEDIQESMTESGRERLNATITSPEFWQHPVSSTMLKLTGMTPYMAAAALPGGLIADASIAMGAVAGVSGALAAGDVTEEIYAKTDKLSDDELKKESKLYRGLRADMGPDEARVQYNETIQGLKPLVAFGLGAASGAFGPAGQIAKGLRAAPSEAAARAAGKAGTALTSRQGPLVAAGEGAATELAEEAYGGYAAQKAAIEGGLQKDYDVGEIIARGLTGGALGGIMGGVSGIGAGRGKGKAKLDEIAAKRAGAGEEDTSVQAETAEAEIAAAVAAGTAPTRGAAKAAKQGVEVVQPGAPNMGEAAAITSEQQPTQPAPDLTPPQAAAPAQQAAAPGVSVTKIPEAAAPAQQAAVRPPELGTSPPLTAAPTQQAAAPNLTQAGAAAPELNPQTRIPATSPIAQPPPVTPAMAAQAVQQTPAPEVAGPQQVAPAPPAPAPAAVPPQAAPVTSEVTPPAPVAQAPQAVAPAPRVLQPTTAKAKIDQLAEKSRRKDVVAKDVAQQEKIAKVPSKKKYTTKEKAAIAERAGFGKDIYETHREPLEMPDKPEARRALAVKLQTVLDKAAEKGLVLHEDLPEHVRKHFSPGKGKKAGDYPITPEEKTLYDRRIPGKVGHPDMSPHVRYLRELADLREVLLGTEFGPKSDERARVQAFITEHNLGERGLELLAERRTEAGERFGTAKRKTTVEQVEGTEAKATISTPVSEGAAAGKSLKDLSPEERAAKIKEVEERYGLKKPTKTELEAAELVREINAREGKIGEAKPESKPAQKEPEPATKEEEVTEEEEEVTSEVTEPAEPTEAEKRQEKLRLQKLASAEKQQELEAKTRLEQAKAAAERIAARKAAGKAVPETVEGKKAAVAAALAKKKAAPLAEDTSKLEMPRIRKLGTGVEALPVRSTTVSKMLNSLDFEHMEGVAKSLAPFMRKMLKDLVGHTNVHIVSDSDMDLVTPDRPGERPPRAEGFFYRVVGGKGEEGRYIVLRESALDNPALAAHVVVHEAVHDVVNRAIERDAGIRGAVNHMMNVVGQFAKGNIEHEMASRYAMTEPREFLTEAFSNKAFQNLLAQIPADQRLIDGLKLSQKKSSVWDAMITVVRDAVQKALGRTLPNGHSMMEAALRIGDYTTEHRGKLTIAEKSLGELQAMIRAEHERRGQFQAETSRLTLPTRDAVQAAVESRAADARVNISGTAKRKLDYFSTLRNLAQRGEKYFGPSNPLNRLFDLEAKMQTAKTTILNKYGGLEAAARIAIAERMYPALMARAKGILFRASLHDVNLDGDNSHLGKDKLMGVQAKNEIVQLQKDWNDPTLNPVRGTLRSALKFYKDIHNAVSRETINNILAEANIRDPELAERIHNNGLTEEDRANFANTKLVDALDQVASLKRRHGSYVPFRRYGDFVSSAEHELSVPSNASQINDNTLQFIDPAPKNGEYGNARARAAVKSYLRSNSHTPQGNKLTPVQVRKVYVDKTNPSQIVEKEDTNAIPAYRVAMQTQHTEFHATQAEALNNQEDLKASGLVRSRTHKREEAYRTDVTNIQSAMGTVLRSLEKQQRYIDADATQKAAMREMFHDLSIGLSGTTNIKNSMRQRRNVAGQSQDLTRVTGDYARMTANHLARLQYRPQMDQVFKEMRDYKDDPTRQDKDKIRRDEIYNAFIDRIYGKSAAQAEEHKPGFVTRLLQVSRLSKLAGVSFHIINMHEPWLTSLSVIGGKHGFVEAGRAIANAYNLIGARAGVVSGLQDMARAYTNDLGFTDYPKLFKEAIAKNKTIGGDRAKRLMDVIDYLAERGLFANASIFEVGQFADPSANIAGRALDRIDLMANQVGTAIEAINRSVTSLPAYELEYKANGGNHEAAMHYAYATTHDTMGDYSTWNAAPIFNTQFGRMALQFKKYGHKTYALLGNIMGGVIKGDPVAMKQFAGLMVTHGLVAGALGLPTEPIKVALILANAAGVTGFTPEDYDYAVRQLAARLAGQKGGEIISKGLYRGIGIEASGRFGWDALLTGFAPKGNRPENLKTFLFDTMAGAPPGYLLDQFAGVQSLMKGDVATAIEKMSPIRAVGDITKAVVGAAGPKVGPTGKETQAQFSPYEVGVRALGFTPSSVAETGAMRGTLARETRRLGADRSELINARLDATGGKIVETQRMIQAWNASHAPGEQITQKDITTAAKRREDEKETVKYGVRVGKRTEAVYKRAESVFNP